MFSIKNLMTVMAFGLLTACASTGTGTAPCCDMPCCKDGTHTCCQGDKCPLHQVEKKKCKYCEEHSH